MRSDFIMESSSCSITQLPTPIMNKISDNVTSWKRDDFVDSKHMFN